MPLVADATTGAAVDPPVDLDLSIDPAELARNWQAADMPAAPRSFRQQAQHRLRRNRTAMFAAAVLLALVLSAIAAPLLSSYDPVIGEATDRLLPIGSPGHLLGTDELGRDMLSRLLHGGRLSLITGLAPVLAATFIGTLVGAGAAYVGGRVESVAMRIMDMLYAFPAVLLAIAIGASLGQGLANVIISLTVIYIAPIARVAQSATRSVKLSEYIEAARLTGASTFTIIRTQVLKNIVSPIFVYASGLVGLSIVIASSLSFLGLGVAPPDPEWGYMLNSLRGSIYVQPWVAALPGLFIFITSIAFNMLADGIRDAFDVKETE
jgi:peptide/nickel transport system permease protein